MIIAMLLAVTAKAQVGDKVNQIKSQVNNIPYVIEGIISKVEVYAGDKIGNVLPKSSVKWEENVGYYYQVDGSQSIGYTKTTLKICRLYKGSDLESQENITVVNGSAELKVTLQNVNGVETQHYMNFATSHSTDGVIMPTAVNQRVVLFCKKNQNGQLEIVSRDFTIQFNSNYDRDVQNNPNYQVEFANGYGKQFYTREELLTFLGVIPTLNTNAKDKCVQKKSAVANEELSNSVKTNYASNLANYTKRLEEFKFRNDHQKTNVASKTLATNLNLTIANARMAGPDAAPRLEFDVLVSSNTGSTYYDGTLLRIIYNSSAFGSSVVANGNVTITRAAPFNTSTYTNPQADVIDQTSNVMGIPFNTDFSASSFSRVLVTTTPQVMLTISLKINTCGNNAGVNFTDISFTPAFSYYSSTAGGSIVNTVAYDNTNYFGAINDNTCIPIINSFNNNVPAGANKVLTIKGRYFGLGKGNGSVIFKDANIGTLYPPVSGPNDGGIQQYDVISWTDSIIKIRMPGIIDSVTASALEPIPGSGKFKVKTRYNKIKESTTPLIIPYGVDWYVDPFPTYRKVSLKLSGQNGSGYVVHTAPNVVTQTGFADAKLIINKAMHDWACVSGINWKLGSDTALATSNDAICVINVGSFSALQRTIRDVRTCNVGGVNVYYLRSFDIEIKNPFSNPSFSWQVDTTGSLGANKYDFYHGIAHELGHAHLLGHVNDTLGDIMFYAAWNGPYPQNQRKLVWTSSGSPYGADYVADSLKGNLSCTGNHVLVFPTNCQGLNIGIRENNNPFQMSVYPNPSAADQNLIVRFETEQKHLTFSLYDITGKYIKGTSEENINPGEYILPFASVDAGLYLLQISNGRSTETVKIMKQ